MVKCRSRFLAERIDLPFHCDFRKFLVVLFDCSPEPLHTMFDQRWSLTVEVIAITMNCSPFAHSNPECQLHSL